MLHLQKTKRSEWLQRTVPSLPQPAGHILSCHPSISCSALSLSMLRGWPGSAVGWRWVGETGTAVAFTTATEHTSYPTPSLSSGTGVWSTRFVLRISDCLDVGSISHDGMRSAVRGIRSPDRCDAYGARLFPHRRAWPDIETSRNAPLWPGPSDRKRSCQRTLR